MLRFHLPPNFAAAAQRDAVPIRVELNLTAPPSPEILPALALLQRWCGPKPPAFLQLKRAQLRELAAVAGDQPLFVENGKTVAWQHDDVIAEPHQSPPPPSSHLSASAPKSRTAARSPHTPLVIDGSEHFL